MLYPAELPGLSLIFQRFLGQQHYQKRRGGAILAPDVLPDAREGRFYRPFLRTVYKLSTF